MYKYTSQNLYFLCFKTWSVFVCNNAKYFSIIINIKIYSNNFSDIYSSISLYGFTYIYSISFSTVRYLCSSCGVFLLLWATMKVKVTQSCPTLCDPMIQSMEFSRPNTGVRSLSLLQGIFPSQESNLGLLHCRRILNQLSHKGSPEQLYMFSNS